MLKNIFSVFCAVLMLPAFLSGCTHENPGLPDPDEGLVPEFVIEQTEIEVPADSCRLEFSYIIENPVEGAVVDAFSDDDWIVDADASVDGKIFVGLTANDSQDAREGTVQVTYSALEEGFSVKIRQMGAEASTDVRAPFEISVIDTEPTAVAYSVTPEDKEMGYITMVISCEAFDRYASDEEYFLNELEYYRMLASAYGVLFEEYLAGILKHGTLSYQYFNALEPETGHYIYAYGLSPQGKRLTDIVKEEFSTEPKPHIEMSFEFDYEVVPGTRADVIVKPGNQENFYYFGVMRTEGLESGYDMADIAQDYLDYVIEYYMMYEGGTIEDAMRTVCYQGVGLNSFDLIPDKEYSLFAVAVDLLTGMVVSDATEVFFDSGEVGPSDNVISLETVYEGFIDARITISTTNDDPYVFCVDLAENYEGMSEEEMLAELTKKDMSYFQRNGDFVADITDRSPGTEYRAFAFGYNGGVATTGLVTTVFATHELGETSNVSITVEHDKYFDGEELKEMYPDEFGSLPSAYSTVMPVSVSISGDDAEGASYCYAFYEGNYMNVSNLYDMVNTLMMEGCTKPQTNFYFLDSSYGKEFTIVAVVCDKDGNFGEIFREVITVTEQGKSPADEYETSINQ